jgi:Asp-tRNA(Asn)/Glu-tRNA(Gln) amidotransferase C subunit
MKAGYVREVIALLERARLADDPREASELIKQAADILALVAELSALDNPGVRVHSVVYLLNCVVRFWG